MSNKKTDLENLVDQEPNREEFLFPDDKLVDETKNKKTELKPENDIASRLATLEKDAIYIKKSEFWKSAIGIALTALGLLALAYCGLDNKINKLNDKTIKIDKRLCITEYKHKIDCTTK
jgi:hypothetical protein